MMCEDPMVAFSLWLPWSQAEDVRRQWRGQVGFYVFAEGPSDMAAFDPEQPNQEVVYMGIAMKSLQGRLNQFAVSLRDGVDRHGAGYRMRRRGANERLLVCTAAIEMERGPSCWAFLRYFERKMIWNYVRRWGALPAFQGR